MKKLKYFYVIPVSILLTGFCFSQNKELIKAQELLNHIEIDSTILIINSIDTLSLSKFDQAKYYEIRGLIASNNDRHDIAFKQLLKSKKIYYKLDSVSQTASINLHIIDILFGHPNSEISSQPFIREYLTFLKKDKNLKNKGDGYATLATIYLNNKDIYKSKLYFDKAIQSAKEVNDTIRATDFLFNKGVVYNTIDKKYDSALFIFKKVIPIYQKNNDSTYIAYSYNNQGEAYKKLGDFNKAIEYYIKADSIQMKKNVLKSKKTLYENLIGIYDSIKDYKNAFKYSKKLEELKDSINYSKQNIAISKIKEQYDNEKLRANNLEIESKRKQNQNLLIGALVFIFFGGITAFLIQKNTKRKQKLAVQEKELETQKLATTLKEQELISIDAMIEGQEKERQSIANDLHDDLGGLMATVKLHFNAFKEKQTLEFFDKTDTLLDEAYQKVRSIAHAKNSGVIAKQGLLKAIQNIADKVSTSNKIKIEVIDHGLEDRLENSLELTIFRIVQELVTNIIKHAEATEATIHLTNHDESLNIMVEDNGKGFNPNQITTKSKGMGISSIDRRIEHLNGSLTIESELSKGTTIIIDIPI